MGPQHEGNKMTHFTDYGMHRLKDICFELDPSGSFKGIQNSADHAYTLSS